MQIVKRYGNPRASSTPYPSLEAALPFTNNNLILTRYVEVELRLETVLPGVCFNT